MRRASDPCFASLVLIVLTASAGSAQTGPVIRVEMGSAPQQPARPGNVVVPPPVGTATVRGHVVATDTGQPLRKAQVRLMSTDFTPGAPRENRLATTDVDGKYEFKDLAAGRYTLTASKGSYVMLSYGQQRPNDPGKPLQVLSAQTVERVDFSLPRGGVITGRIVDEYGEPMSNLQVAVVSWQIVNGQRRLMSSGRTGSTDDLGEFRLFGIPPGRYLVQATWRPTTSVPPPGARAGDRIGYPPTLFPGVTQPSRGQPITIGIGDTVSDLAFAMLPIKTTTISGTVSDSQGRPMQGTLMVMHESGGGYMSTGAGIQPDGTFVVAGLPPGEYTLRSMPSGPGAAAGNEMAVAKITATGEDITDLHLLASKPSVMSGRIVVDPSNTGAPPRLALMAMPVDPDVMPTGGGPGRVNDDGTFELPVRPGRTGITLMNGVGWVIRSVRLDGTDVIDSGVDVKPGENLTRLEVEVTNRVTTVSGLVTNARGEPAKSYSAIVFSQDRERWTSNSRYQGSGRPDRDGRFKVTGLPPASYYIVAVDRIEPGQVQDPDFLERMLPKAIAFALNDGETRVIDLRLTLASER
jgi:hypothetical protein